MRFLFVDRILELEPGKSVRGLKHITASDVYLCEDENQKLCFMPSLIGETLGQLAAWNVMFSNDFTKRPVAGIVAKASLHKPAYLNETLELESIIESIDDEAVLYHANAYINKELVFSVEGALGPLLPMADFIEMDVVRNQFEEIYRPGSCSFDLLDKMPAWTNSERPSLRIPFLFDNLLQFEKAKGLVAIKQISRAAPYFADHFPKKPVLPMTVLLEAKMNLAADFVKNSFDEAYKIKALRKIKMNEFVFPGDSLISTLKVKEINDAELILTYRSEVDGKRVCVLEVVMSKS